MISLYYVHAEDRFPLGDIITSRVLHRNNIDDVKHDFMWIAKSRHALKKDEALIQYAGNASAPSNIIKWCSPHHVTSRVLDLFG